MEYILKNPRDTRDYVIKMERWLRGKERIAFASASVKPSSMIVERVKFTETAVVLRIAGGGNNARHTVSMEITTTVGQVKSVQFGILTRGDSLRPEVLPLVTASGDTAFLDYGPDVEWEPEVAVGGSMAIFLSQYSDEPDPGEEPEPSTDPFPLVTSGRRILRPNGEALRIKAINWTGFESAGRAPGGLSARSYKALIDQAASWGFNTLRIPFAGNSFDGSPCTGIDLALNPDLQSATPGQPKPPVEVLDAIVAYAASKSVMVILDHHRRVVGSGGDGSPIGSGYTKAQWMATWGSLGTRYANSGNVIGGDLHNEPSAHAWDEWASLAEECGNALHQVAPEWLIFVQGVQMFDSRSYWPGGQLGGVVMRPVALNKRHKLVYSAHDYGQSMGAQPWLATAAQPVPQYPLNLPPVFQGAWGFILEQGIAPLLIGAFGGAFGLDSAGVSTPSAELEKQWAIQLSIYLNNNEGHFAYWGLNPDIPATGGLLRNDWVTVQGHKLQLLLPLLTATQ